MMPLGMVAVMLLCMHRRALRMRSRRPSKLRHRAATAPRCSPDSCRPSATCARSGSSRPHACAPRAHDRAALLARQLQALRHLRQIRLIKPYACAARARDRAALLPRQLQALRGSVTRAPDQARRTPRLRHMLAIARRCFLAEKLHASASRRRGDYQNSLKILSTPFQTCQPAEGRLLVLRLAAQLGRSCAWHSGGLDHARPCMNGVQQGLSDAQLATG